MVKIAEFEITQRDLYMPESRTPIKGGVLDLRLVTIQIICCCGNGISIDMSKIGYNFERFSM
jgi:DNA-directed RNA polymerase III subunit RPC1